MNVLSKILIIAFISISLQSISAQDYIDEVNTDGIVKVWNSDGRFSSTGFFVGPHTLVTALYNIGELEGEVSNNLFIIPSKTTEHIPVHSVQAIHPVYNLAVLHIKDYESPVYYDLFEGSEKSLSSSEVYLFDIFKTSFPKLEGTLSPQYHFEKHYRKTLEFFDPRLYLSGLNGSPIFSNEGKVIGMLTSISRNKTRTLHGEFSYIKNVKKLLQVPSLNCHSGDCVREEAFSILRKEVINTDGIVTVTQKLTDKDFTGFFIGLHTLVTDFHAIDGFEGEASENLFIIHPKTKEHIPVHSIQAVHYDHKLAVLHIKDYESPVYYDLLEDSEESLSSEEVYLFDIRDTFFPIIEGTLSPQHHSENQYEKTLEFFYPSLDLLGLTGSPTFSTDGKVIGVLTGRYVTDHHVSPKFAHIEAVKKLLLAPSLHCQSAQDCIQKDFVRNPKFTDGIVKVINKGTAQQGTGFFINPHTLITAWHVIDNFKGNVSDDLFIIHPKTEKLISVHSIQALDFDNDLAVLHVKDYESPVYYDLFEGSETSLSYSEAYMFDRRDAIFPKLEGTLSPWYYFERRHRKTLDFFDNDLRLFGLSGSPIFSKEGQVIGVHTSQMIRVFFFPTDGIFTRIIDAKALLLKPSLNCQSRDCIQEEEAPYVTMQNKIADRIKGLFTEGSE